eukprot:scaffold228_cov312-Pinguiococcus_pyrenoidosus.AAC.25
MGPPYAELSLIPDDVRERVYAADGIERDDAEERDKLPTSSPREKSLFHSPPWNEALYNETNFLVALLGHPLAVGFRRTASHVRQALSLGGRRGAAGLLLLPGAERTLPVPGEAESRAAVDEELGRVELSEDSILGGSVVKGVLVVPVVPALPNGRQRHQRVLRRVAVRIVRVVAVDVRGRVDEPREVQHRAVAQCAGHPERGPELLAPPIRGDQRREDVAHEQRKPRVHALLEHDVAVGLQVREVQLSAGLDHVGVLLEVQPAHVREEEASRGVVRIGVGLRVLVVHPVVPRPVVDGALVGDGVAQH